jgi:hypothetical protein
MEVVKKFDRGRNFYSRLIAEPVLQCQHLRSCSVLVTDKKKAILFYLLIGTGPSVTAPRIHSRILPWHTPLGQILLPAAAGEEGSTTHDDLFFLTCMNSFALVQNPFDLHSAVSR